MMSNKYYFVFVFALGGDAVAAAIACDDGDELWNDENAEEEVLEVLEHL